MATVARILRIGPGEGRVVASVVGLMFVASAGLTIGESSANAMFFDRIGPDALPVMYLAQGVAGIVAMLALTVTLSRFDRLRIYVLSPVLLAFTVVAERAVVASGPAWIFRVLWLTVALASLLQSVGMWGAAGVVTDTRSAKRLFPVFGSGAILGSVVGGLVTRPLAGAIGVSNLLLVWAACLLAASVLAGGVLQVRWRRRSASPRARHRSSAIRDITEGFRFVRDSPLLMWMTAAAVLFSVLFYSLFLPFAQAATARFPDPEALAGFLGVFGASVTAVAFLMSVFLANRLLAWLGAAVVVLVLPVLYGGSFGILLASSAFATLVAVRAGVMVWLQGVSSPAWETLVNVVPDTRRDQVRAFFSGGPSQTGTAIAGVITLVGQQVLTATQLSLIGLVVALITIVVGWRIRRSYAGALVDALRAGRPHVFGGRPLEGSPVVLETDATAIGLALETCRDPDPRLRRLGVELLSTSAEDDRVRAELEGRTMDPDPTVRALAMDALAGTGAIAMSVIDRALEDEDASVRTSAVEALTAMTVDHPSAADRLRAVGSDPDLSVRAAAGVGLLGPDRPQALQRLRELLSDDDGDARVAAVRALRSAPSDDAATLAETMLDDPSPAVRSAALRTIARAAPETAITFALEAMEGSEPALRETALEVLGGCDLRPWTPEIEGLARSRSSLALADLALADGIPRDGESGELLRTAVLERGRANARVALSAIALVSRDGEAIRTALDNLLPDEPGQLATALEALEATDHRSLTVPLLPLWEPVPDSTTPRDDWLDVTARDPDPIIRSCVELIRTSDRPGGTMSRSRTSMSSMERVLALKKVPLFATLTVADLRSLADVAEERSFVRGDVISSEGELGDELHVVLEGTVSVVRGDGPSASVVAHRGPGDVVGEMSILTHHPRVASLVAQDDLRTIRIGQREFEGMIRERPDVSLAMLRVLAERLDVETRDRSDVRPLG